VNNTYLNETYLPRTVAFHHCGDAAALAFARTSTETVLRVLRILFDRELASEGNERRQFTADEVEDEARKTDSSVESSAIFTGLYLAQEFSVFTAFAKDERQVGIVSFSIGERVYETRYLDWGEHVRQSNLGLVYDQNAALGLNAVPSPLLLESETALPRIDDLKLPAEDDVPRKQLPPPSPNSRPAWILPVVLACIPVIGVIWVGYLQYGPKNVDSARYYSAIVQSEGTTIGSNRQPWKSFLTEVHNPLRQTTTGTSQSSFQVERARSPSLSMRMDSRSTPMTYRVRLQAIRFS
jgi:hypothetical protein